MTINHLDDAQQSVRLAPAGVWAAARQWGARLLRPRQLIDAVTKDRGLFQLVALGTFGLGLTLLLAILASVLYDDWQNSLYLLVFSPIAVSLLSGFMRLGSSAGNLLELAKREIVRAMLARNQCPCCAYEVTANPVQASAASSLIRCPECGSQWLTARLGTTREPPATVVIIHTAPAASATAQPRPASPTSDR